MLITVAVLAILRNVARDICRRLMDSVDPALVGQVERVLSGVDGVQQVKTVSRADHDRPAMPGVHPRWRRRLLRSHATFTVGREPVGHDSATR